MASARTPDLHHPAGVAELDAPRSSDDGFAACLRERTKLVHREAERSGFLADLLRGRADRSGYALFLRNLVPIYEALEIALAAARDDPRVAPFAAEDIRRLPRLIRDVAAIGGPNWARDLPLLPEAEAYARAIRDAAAGADGRLVAHAYARYLGDLSGGQILRPLLARSLGLVDGELAFYDFPEIADVDLPKAAMRRCLDTIPSGSAAAEAIVAEAIAAFRHNIALSDAISRAV